MSPQRLARFLDARSARRTGGGPVGDPAAPSAEGPRTTVGARGVLITGTAAPKIAPELAALDLPAIALPAQQQADALQSAGDATAPQDAGSEDAAPQDAPPGDAGAEPAAGHPADRRRRPASVLASALVGTLCLGALLTSGELPAQAAPSEPAGATSVAEELGLLRAQQNALTEDEAALRLQEMVASRALREDAEAAAAQAQAAADQAARDAAAEAARPDVVLPVDGARLTSGFGSRWGTLHAGIDLAAPMHTPEYAVMDGVVLKAGAASGYGLAVYLQHDDGVVTVYGHMDSILVEEGQTVRAGETIALLGNRGRSSGPHLHFEVHLGGMDQDKVDPVAWLREHGVHI